MLSVIDQSGIAAKGIGAANMPVGAVLQVVQSVKTDRWGTSSTSFIDVSGLIATITPSSASSKILVCMDLTVSTYGHGDIRLAKTISGVQQLLAIGDASSTRTRSTCHFYNYTSFNTTWTTNQASAKCLDAPGTTQPITYSVQAAAPYSSSYWTGINNQYNDGDAAYSATTFSSITLMEIAG